MNLIEHVLAIRQLIHRAFDGKLERIGINHEGYVDDINLSNDDVLLRKRLKGINDVHLAENNGDYQSARAYTLKQCVFTLFNRMAAIKLMEQKEMFPEVIKQRPENGGLSAAHQAWLEQHPEGRGMERDGLIAFFSTKFHEMAENNFLIYQEDHPYAMMPTADEMNEIVKAFNAIEEDPDTAEAWKSDDILGWLYENFNAVEKVELKESGEKVEYDKVSLQSQVYTPSWVVKFLVDNSLGKLYLEMFPDSEIVKPNYDGQRKYAIANRPTERKRAPKEMTELRVIDPACGSGNFLLYAFSLLYDMYTEQVERYGKKYTQREIPALIIENNLFGVDLDERAVQLAQIGLLIKARETGGRRARVPGHTNVVCSNFYLPSYEEVKEEFGYDASWENTYDKVAKKIWTDLSEAHKFGTLVRVEEQLNVITPDEKDASLFASELTDTLFEAKKRMKKQLRELVSKYGEQHQNPYTLLKMNEAITFLDIVSSPFDAVVANPPYTDSGDFGSELKKFVEENYRKPLKFNTNLYACFIKRCCELAGEDGKVGMIHPHTFMFIKTFEDVRTFMLDNTHINVMVDYGLDRVNLFGPGILLDATFYTLDMEKNYENGGVYFNITAGQQEKFKKDSFKIALEDYINNQPNDRVYTLPQSKLKGIKSYPFIYWISDEFREKFGGNTVSDYIDVVKGLTTSDNNRFLRFWWEIPCEKVSDDYKRDHRKWVRYVKGGPFNKWYGNMWTLLNWENDGYEIKHFVDVNGKQRSRPQNVSYYFREGITYSAAGSKGASFRYLPFNYVIDAGGPGIYSNKYDNVWYTLGFLNSKLVYYICDCLNPTVNINQGDLWRVPFVIPNNNNENKVSRIVEQNVLVKKYNCQFSLIEENYNYSPIKSQSEVPSSIHSFYNNENALLTLVLLNESIINQIVFDIYQLTDHDRQMVIEKEGIPVGDYPVSRKAKTAYLKWLEEESEFKASDEVVAHLTKLQERDDLPRITDFETLYQKNNEWEEFCIKHQMNPVEVWWQFLNANILPPQRTQVLAFELVTDVIRSLLAKDDDGVIPLNANSGEVQLAPRIEAEMINRGYAPAQIAQVFSLLGSTSLDRYLRERFFQQLSDHLNLFMYLPKTPFIWHITSGPAHALDLFVSIYRWNRDTLLRIKSVYAANRESALNDRLQVLLKGDATQKAQAAEVRDQLKELASFCGKVDGLLASGYDPKLDDGVGKNIAPLQKAGIISYEVLNKGQLKKYLNADW